MSFANSTTTTYCVHDTSNNIGFYSYSFLKLLSYGTFLQTSVFWGYRSRGTQWWSTGGCWRPRTVHSDVTSDIIGRTEKVRFALLRCSGSLPLMGVQVHQPVMLCMRDKTGWRMSQQWRSGCMVLLDSFLSLLGLCLVLSLLRVRAWQMVVSLRAPVACWRLNTNLLVPPSLGWSWSL